LFSEGMPPPKGEGVAIFYNAQAASGRSEI
jgi:hypothetical protein